MLYEKLVVNTCIHVNDFSNIEVSYSKSTAVVSVVIGCSLVDHTTCTTSAHFPCTPAGSPHPSIHNQQVWAPSPWIQGPSWNGEMQGGRDEGQRKEEERKGEKSEEGMWRRDSLDRTQVHFEARGGRGTLLKMRCLISTLGSFTIVLIK